MKKVILVLVLNLTLINLIQCGTFDIDYERNTFRMDGKPFRYVSGSMHYFRVPQELWMDRLLKARAAGLNAIQFVVQWNLHEPEPGTYNFDGNLDIVSYMEMAHKVGLNILLRPGPYICAERDGGGLPYWLYRDHPGIKLRSSDPDYLAAVDRWWKVLLPKIIPLLYQNGGPIIMVQLENEYGSYGLQTSKCDIIYMNHLRDLARNLLGNEVVLYTTDGDGDDYLRCGKTPDVYATVDFGPGTDVNKSFSYQRMFEPRGPLVNSEFYPGWLDYWGQPHNTVDANSSAKSLDEILSVGANVNIYMIHGGTSFGFESGTNIAPTFSVEPTSYDYDAPISEAGDLTDKYFAFQKVISKYLPLPQIEVNATVPKGNYGKVMLTYASTFFESRGMLLKFKETSTYPKSFEQLRQDRGFVLYETVLTKMFTDPSHLSIASISDRGYIFINGEPKGIFSRAETTNVLPISVLKGDVLQILVENQGRIGYGPNAKDFKGILSNVTLGGIILTNWNMSGLALDDGNAVEKYAKSVITAKKTSHSLFKQVKSGLEASNGQSSFWYGEFQLPNDDEEPKETFIRLNGWSKGAIFINGFNIGRYWPIMGPQETLYVPSSKLKPSPQTNTIVLLELEKPGCNPNSEILMKSTCSVELVDNHVINGPTPEQPKKQKQRLFTRS